MDNKAFNYGYCLWRGMGAPYDPKEAKSFFAFARDLEGGEACYNIAMLYLADEMFKNRHETFRITIGKPIPWQTFDKSKSPTEWAEDVKETVYKLKENSNNK